MITKTPNDTAAGFILSAEDHDLACSVLQMQFFANDIEQLVALVPDAQLDDPQLWNRNYELNDSEWRQIAHRFSIPFDTAGLEDRNITVCLWRLRGLYSLPYLVHTGYELLLLLDGRKKLARMGDSYPPMAFPGEEAFDRRVATGELYREEVLESFDKPIRQWLGQRTVYYTPKGQEWRIPTMRLLWEVAMKSGGWNETYERLEGTLFGYEDWQNDWWAEQGRRRGRYGIPFCCTVSKEGLIWIKSAGFKALPPIADEVLRVHSFDFDNVEHHSQILAADPDAVAVVQFSVHRKFITELLNLKAGGPWAFPEDKISDLNREIRGLIEIVTSKL